MSLYNDLFELSQNKIIFQPYLDRRRPFPTTLNFKKWIIVVIKLILRHFSVIGNIDTHISTLFGHDYCQMYIQWLNFW